MGLGIGIFLIAAGAILAFAVKTSTVAGSHGGIGGVIDISTVGWILLIVGAISIVLSLVLRSSWAGAGRFARSSSTSVDGSGRVTRRDTTESR